MRETRAWAIRRDGYLLPWTVDDTRSGCIERYENITGASYRDDARLGEAKAVRVRISLDRGRDDA